MEDPFGVKELRIRQPARFLPGRARYDFFDSKRKLLAIATEVEPRSVLQKMADLVPKTRAIALRTPAGEPLLNLLKSDNDWLAEATDPDGNLIGTIQIDGTRRDYTLIDEAGQVAGQVNGDLAVKQFVISGPEGERYARLAKTFAGPVKELLTSSDHYSVSFIGPVPHGVRMLIFMMPVVLDMTRWGPY